MARAFECASKQATAAVAACNKCPEVLNHKQIARRVSGKEGERGSEEREKAREEERESARD